jgi:hypothetical protein
MLRWAGWLLVGILVAAAAYELALALRHEISPDGEGFVLLIALVAMLVGTVLVFRHVGPAGLFAPAAAFFVTARFYTGDPYDRPTFQTYGDSGMFPPTWIFILLALALLAGITTQLWRRTAPVESAVVLLLLALTALFMGAGH